MAQMKEQIKAPKIELSNKEKDSLSDAQFKTMVIRMLTEMVEYDHKREGRLKAMQVSREKYSRKRRKWGLKSMIWSRRKV